MSKKILLPGAIDIHTHLHLHDLGQGKKEDPIIGCATLAGGYVAIFDMPNKPKAIFTLKLLQQEIEIVKPKIVCDVGFYFGSDGKNLDEFKKVKKIVMGLKVYLNKTTGHLKLDDPNDLEKIYNAWPEDAGPILLHAEKDMIPFSLAIAQKIRRKTHYCHISTKEDLRQIIKAKHRNVPVTCGVTPHHLFLTKDDTKRLGSFGCVKPELTSQKDVDYLWQNLRFIDVIESDHAPHMIGKKLSEKFPFGLPGLETTLPLMLTAVTQGRLTLSRLIKLISTNPQKILGIKLPESTFTIVDLSEKHVLNIEELKTKCGWTPFAGREVQGKVKAVFIRGRKVFENGKVLAKPGSGKILKPEQSSRNSLGKNC